MTATGDFYSARGDGIFVPSRTIEHLEERYDSAGFALLRDMQRRHFWYRGRHRFILNALRSQLRRRVHVGKTEAIDLGGGCGGWISFLQSQLPDAFDELAIGDSSCDALVLALAEVGPKIGRYQIDLLDLQWNERWDVAFLLDVLEHIPADEQALRQIWNSLRPGGLLFATTPALNAFWSYNDEMVHHVRRYSRSSMARVGQAAGFETLQTRYFMFFLSPLLALSRMRRIKVEELTRDEIQDILKRSHRVPTPLVNEPLAMLFELETPLGHYLPFPWGTSVLGVFRKPLTAEH